MLLQNTYISRLFYFGDIGVVAKGAKIYVCRYYMQSVIKVL